MCDRGRRAGFVGDSQQGSVDGELYKKLKCSLSVHDSDDSNVSANYIAFLHCYKVSKADKKVRDMSLEDAGRRGGTR